MTKESIIRLYGIKAGKKLYDFLYSSCSTFCCTIKSCLGISDSGDSNKFLNQQGDWEIVSGGGGGSSPSIIPTDYVSNSNPATYNDPAYVDVVGSSLSITLSTTTSIWSIVSYDIIESGGGGSAAEGYIRIVIDTQNGDGIFIDLAINGNGVGSTNFESTPLAPGTYTVKLQIYRSSGTRDFILNSFKLFTQGQEATGTVNLKYYKEPTAAPLNTPVSTGTGAIAIGDGAEANFTALNAFGYNAGSNSSNALYSNFIGYGAGKNSSNSVYCNFIGLESGQSHQGQEVNCIGYGAGKFGISNYSDYLGALSGQSVTGDKNTFLGYGSGYGNSYSFVGNSQFIGFYAGLLAYKASNSIFIGYQAGNLDIVDNSTGGSSILIGKNTNTGGFSNSIAMGESAINTKTNQFMIGSVAKPIEEIAWNGILRSSALHNNVATQGDATKQDVRSGIYTPTINNVINATVSNNRGCMWYRLGNIIHVSGSIDLQAQSPGLLVKVSIELPVNTTFSLFSQLLGSGVIKDTSQVQTSPSMYADVLTGNLAIFEFTDSTSLNLTYNYWFTYEVI